MPSEKVEEISDDFSNESGIKKGIKKIPILIGGALVLIVVAYLLVIKVIAPMLSDDKAAVSEKIEKIKPEDNPTEVIKKTDEGEEGSAETKQNLGDIFSFGDDFMINPLIVDESDEPGILIVNVALEVDNKEVVPELTTRTPQLRDLLILMISSKRYSELNTLDAKERMKNDMIKELNKILINGKVTNVFFQKFQFQIM